MTDDRIPEEELPSAEELDEWRDAFLLVGAADQAPGITDEELVALAQGELAGPERLRVAERVLARPGSSREYQLLRQVHEQVSQKLVGSKDVRRKVPSLRRTTLRAVLSMAAGVAIAVAGLWLVVVPNGSLDPGLGPNGPGWAQRNVPEDVEFQVEPSQDARLTKSPTMLAISPLDGAGEYRVTLLGAEGERLWESLPSSSPQFELPDEVKTKLQPGESYHWFVRVTGERIKAIGPFQFSLLP